ncbi:ABC transporter substrate-binding protein [Sphingomonas adhaesiva]|uniref:ABC transporter substrate-binding protein n=1 Tax=Sphingomonas adhaesiva TaxID=28212 RepID=UPI002FF80B81
MPLFPHRRRAAAAIAALAALAATGSCGRRPDVGPVVASVIGGAPELAGRTRAAMPTGDRLLTDALAEGLVRFDAAGQIEPGVAERWIVTDEGMSYIFRLRNARWPDGAPVRAAEVVALLRRQIAAASGNDIAPYLSAVASVVEMTPEVIEIELSRPRPDLLKLFAQPELALVRARPAGGAGPFRRKEERHQALLLSPAIDPDRDPDEARPAPEDEVLLRGERAASAIVRFVERDSDLVTGGTIADWPLVQAANPAPVNIRIDPAAGLFGLAVVRRDGFLADAANRAAVAQAIDRADLATGISPDWVARDTVLPEQLDSALAPAIPLWASVPAEQRADAARATVARWRAAHGVPQLGIALPGGPGGTLLWARIARDLYAIGIRPVRLAPDDAGADLRLVDRVAPYDSARWYLAEACVACSEQAAAAIEAARLADTLAGRAQALATADAALASDVAFVPLGRPFRWSLVALRLRQWQANARAWHPLNRLRADTN